MGEDASSRLAAIGIGLVFGAALAFPILTVVSGESQSNLKSEGDPSSASIAGDTSARSIADQWLPTDGYFIENAGQLRDARVHYYGFAAGLEIGLGESAVVFSPTGKTEIPASEDAGLPHQPSELLRAPVREDARGGVVRLTFAGSDRVAPVAQGELSHVSHHYVGDDPSRWRTNVRHYHEVMYPNLYDGIDLFYRIGPNGLKYEFRVAPGADPGLIQLAYGGVDELVVDGDGVALRTAQGEIRDGTPVSYEDDGTPVRCDFATRETFSIGFSCGSRDASRELVIDPSLSYSTLLGGTGFDFAFGVATDASGNVYVTGGSFGPDFLGNPSSDDVFVAKLDPLGNPMVVTLLGGSGSDFGQGIAVDQAYNIYVTGFASPNDFPTTGGAFFPVSDTGNGFVAKLDSMGNLVYATYLGGSPNDIAVVDLSSGTGTRVYVTGTATSPDFPKPGTGLVGAFDGSCGTDGFCNAASDAFLVVLSPDGSGDADLRYATFLGGSRVDEGWGVAVDLSGIAYLTGWTALEVFWPDPATTDFPFTVTYGPSGDECCLAPFLASVDPSGSGPLDLNWAADLGGSGAAVDVFGNVYASGTKFAPSYPCPASIGPVDGVDAVVSKLTPGGTMVYSTCIGGSGQDGGVDVAADAVGRVYLSGITQSPDLVGPGCIQCSYGGGESDSFVALLDPSGTGLTFFTYLGGSGVDNGGRISVFRPEILSVAGETNSPDFPTTIGPPYQGSTDAFVSSFTFDGDQDGIFDEIDTQPGTPSNVFEDKTGSNSFDAFMSAEDSGGTQGKIAGGNGNLVLVDDEFGDILDADTGTWKLRGMNIGVVDTGSSTGDSDFEACPTGLLETPPTTGTPFFSGSGWSFSMAPGSSGVLTCSSLVLEMITGQAIVHLPDFDVVIPEGAIAAFTEPEAGTVRIQVDPASTSDILIGGMPLGPGGTATFDFAPEVMITGPPSGSVFAVGSPVMFTATFTDTNAAQTHTALWELGTISLPGSVSESGGSGSVSGTFTFTAPGVYYVKLIVTDGGGLADIATTVDGLTAMVVIYDPDAGFVTGGGWINSPQGAYTLDPTLTGKAVFGFVSRYQKGANVPTGQTEFQFKVANLNFHSTAYEWLVVSGCRAQYKGSGTINGAGDYGFLLTAIDGQQPGGGGVDKFRIKIWDKTTGQVIYDSQMGADDFADPTTALGSGSIVIHKT